MNAALKAVSLLLSYPTAQLQEEAQELKLALARNGMTGPREQSLLAALIDDIAGRDLYDAQERYVYLFDRTRSLSLHLFEHIHGESRDRGQAMVDLMAMYEESGFDIDAKELPDYLPLFIEYLSLLPPARACELLAETAHIIAALRQRLRKRKSVYANAFLVLERMANARPDAQAVQALLEEPEDDPDDLAAIEAIWEEEAVTFGGNAGEGECGPDRLQRQMRAWQRRAGDTAAAK